MDSLSYRAKANLLISSMCIPGAADGGSVTSGALLRALRKMGVCVSLCTSDYGKHTSSSGDPDIHMFSQTIAKPLDLSLGVQRFLWRHVSQVDICHFFAFYATATALGARLARRRGVPYVISPIGNTVPENGQGRERTSSECGKQIYFELIGKPVLRHAAFIICASEMERDRLSSFVPEGRFVVLPHGREEQNERVQEKPVQLPPHACLVFFLGRLSPEKSLPFLLDTWADVRRRNPQALLVIAGDDRLCPGYQRLLRDKVSELGLERAVCFTGSVDGAQKKWLLERCVCLVLPSKHENFGHVVVEALAAGRPAITSVGTPWKKMAGDGVGRWLPLDRAAWANCLHQYISNADRNAQSDSPSRCRAWVRENIPTWDESAESHLRVYEEAIRDARNGHGPASRITFARSSRRGIL